MKKILILVVIIVLLVAGIAAWYLYDRTAQQPTAAPVAVIETAPEPPAPEIARPEPEPLEVPMEDTAAPSEPEDAPLPVLAESDGYVRAELSEVVGEAGSIQYFPNEGLVARAVATVDALGSRQVPGNIQAVAGPGGEYAAVPDPDPPREILDEAGDPLPQYRSNPANAGRYRAYVEMLEAVEAEQFETLYERNAPLFEQAWRELGYTDKAFEGRLVEVIDELLATPEVAEPYQLIKPEAYYLFANEELENLTAGQKILLRMGSENASRVKAKLREIREVIDHTGQE